MPAAACHPPRDMMPHRETACLQVCLCWLKTATGLGLVLRHVRVLAM